MRRLSVVPHLPSEELEQRYKSCRDAAEKFRWHLIWLVGRAADPLPASRAAELCRAEL